VGSRESTLGLSDVRLDVRRLNADYSPSRSGSPLEVLDGSVALPINRDDGR
jgi:hypothetical protein